MSFFFLTFEKGRGAWVYLFIIILLIFFIIYIFLSHFLPPAGGEGGMGFIFLPFCYFLYYVFSFCYRFLLLQGKGVWVYFSFLNYYLIYFQ